MDELAANSIKVLLIEDDKHVSECFRKSYKKASDNYPFGRLQTAESFSEGLSWLKKEKFDVVTLDMSLPEANGLDALVSLRALAPNLPVVVSGAKDEELLIKSAMKAGAVASLSKDQLGAESLGETLYSSVEISRLRQENAQLKEEVHHYERFAAELLKSVSAEFNQPLYQISRLCSGNKKLSKSEKLQVIDQARELSDIHNNLVLYSSLQADSLNAEKVDFDLLGVIDQVVANLERVTEVKELSVSQIADENVSRLLRGELNLFTSVVKNLFQTAVAVTKPQSRLILETCSEKYSDTHSCVHFSILIDAFELSKIEEQMLFEIFNQANGAAVKRFGVKGLRLSVCNSLAKLLNGKIWIEKTEEFSLKLNFTSQLEIQ